MKFLEIPFIPKAKVSLCAVSESNKKIIENLKNLGVNPIIITACPDLSIPVNSHADMLIHTVGGNRVYVSGEYEYTTELRKYGFCVEMIDKKLSSVYPNDVLLNIANINGNIFCNEKIYKSNLMDYYKRNANKIIFVNQGYSKCSTCIITECAIITSDTSIYNAARINGFDVLKIREGFISLPGYNHGFIGGCSGLIDKNILAFTGNIKEHPDYFEIKAFAQNYNINLLSLTNNTLNDIGGIIPLMEKTDFF